MMQTLGVIGGGQLGRMLALDAKRMGYHVIVLDPQEHSPGGQVADEQIVAAYDNMAAVDDLGRRTDIVTYEFENIAIESVLYLEAHGFSVSPSSNVLRITQDRVLEKRFIRECGIATADFEAIECREDIAQAVMTVGLPGIVKTARGGYDGKGQWLVRSLEEGYAAFAAAKGARLIYERLVSFAKELSIVATRDANDDVISFPICENIHDRGILSMTIAPGRVTSRVSKLAADAAESIGRRLGIVGTYCVELFLVQNDQLFVNEIAPRPHNSGHYTMDATPCSQYEEHVRAISALPLSPPQLFRSAIMCNILGDGRGDYLHGVHRLLANPSIVLHLYGKRHAVARRKMGHFTMLLDSAIDDAAIARALSAHRHLRWETATT